MRYDISRWEHDHVFDRGNAAGERGTRAVTWLTAVMMVVEIVAGWWYNSMALLADGFHISSHALAIGLSALRMRPLAAMRRTDGSPSGHGRSKFSAASRARSSCSRLWL